VALERETIEKKDFPVGRRGYDTSAVDAHLRTLADEFDELKRSNRQRTESRTETLAATASDRVRGIIEAAETSGAEIRRQAEEEAREIRSDANREAKREREQAARAAQTEREEAAAEAERQRDEASSKARDYVGRVSESTSQILARVEAMEVELGTLTESLRTGAAELTESLRIGAAELTESLRTGAGKLTAELEVVETEMTDLSSFAAAGGAVAATASRTVQEQPPLPAEAEPELVPDEKVEEESETVVVGTEPAAEAEPAADAETAADDEAPEAAEGNDAEGARLIALNMALNGTPREETDRYLAENFDISNRGRLLDEVYASVEG
jgi:DivIVA domain-containing protein